MSLRYYFKMGFYLFFKMSQAFRDRSITNLNLKTKYFSCGIKKKCFNIKNWSSKFSWYFHVIVYNYCRHSHRLHEALYANVWEKKKNVSHAVGIQTFKWNSIKFFKGNAAEKYITLNNKFVKEGLKSLQQHAKSNPTEVYTIKRADNPYIIFWFC